MDTIHFIYFLIFVAIVAFFFLLHVTLKERSNNPGKLTVNAVLGYMFTGATLVFFVCACLVALEYGRIAGH